MKTISHFLGLKIFLSFLAFGLFQSVSAQPFITTWKTDNTGSSSDNQITIPTTGSGYNYTVDWGDGNMNTGVTGNITHTYASAGTYQVSISGNFPWIYFNNIGDKLKILSIDQWGNIQWITMQRAFYGCSNLVVNATDIPDLSGVDLLNGMFRDAPLANPEVTNWDVSNINEMLSVFRNATAFNGDVSGWDVSNVTSTESMFLGATSFDQNLGAWDVSSVIDMTDMFLGAGISTENYDNLLIGWNNLSLQNNVTFHAGSSKYCLGEMARNEMIADHSWNISDAGRECAFVTTWKTDNPGASNNNQITIPTSGGGYNYTVIWGDGNMDTGVNGDITHTYASAGIYTVRITGSFPRILFKDAGDPQKILTIDQWGSQQWASMTEAFYNCTNLTYNATDIPDLSMATQISGMFVNCHAFNGDIGNWDVSTISDFGGLFVNCFAFNQDLSSWDVSNSTTMEQMFFAATSFNQNLNNWDVSEVQNMSLMFNGASSLDQNFGDWNVTMVSNMTGMFDGVTLSTANYDNTLIGWESLPPLQPNVVFSGGNSYYCDAESARANMINTYGWTITDAGLDLNCFEPFVTTWKTDNPGGSADNQITIPTAGIGYNYNIDWGDGIIDQGVTGDITHTYDFPGTYTVSIRGSFPRIFFNTAGDREKILSIEAWGEIAWQSMDRAFAGCSNLVYNATDVPDLSAVSIMQDMFNQASNFNGAIGNWNVSTVTNMDFLFAESAFNQDISSWDVSNVQSMNGMFYRNANFNQDIGTWNTSSVTSTLFMFVEASQFNKNLSGWDMSHVTNTSYMFHLATSFDQPIGNWIVDQVTDMNHMFDGATSFDQDVSDWNVGKVTNMTNMFRGVTLSSTNYDNLLIQWQAIPTIQQNINFHGGNSQYCIGKNPRDLLINNSNWTIIDGGENCDSAFITQWKTDNPGTSTDFQISIPVVASLNSYNYDVDWGDGAFSTGLTGSTTHTYPVPGIYTVKITGDVPRIYFNNQNDKLKIISIDQWGGIQWTSMARSFYGCANLIGNATDTPDLSQVTSCNQMFYGAALYNQDINNWDVSNVEDMSGMFQDAISFNSNLSNWDVSNVRYMGSMFQNVLNIDQDFSSWQVTSIEDMTDMFSGTGLSTANYDYTLLSWSTQPVKEVVYLGAGNSYYCLSQQARNNLINNKFWTITDLGKVCDQYFQTTWQTNAPGATNPNEITIPTFGSGYHYNVHWGDGTYDEGVTGNITHQYGAPGQFTVSISGDFPRIYISNIPGFDQLKLSSIDNWGIINWKSMGSAFWGCNNMIYAASDVPDLSDVTDMSFMFFGCQDFTGDLNGWDVSNVINMSGLFNDSGFNGTIDSWNVGNVEDMSQMFKSCSFNQPIPNWNVSKVENLSEMFQGPSSFDQDLGNWDVSNVTDFSNMFRNNVSMSTFNYDNLLVGWNALPNLANNMSLTMGSFTNYCHGEAARNNLITNKGWTISDAGKDCSEFFITTWKTDNPGSAPDQITIPTTASGLNYTIDWGDGTREKYLTSAPSHTYISPGTYSISIIGNFPNIEIGGSTDKDKLLSVDNWGNISWGQVTGAFFQCSNVSVIATDAPDLSNVTDLSFMWKEATSFNDNIDHWDVSTITRMRETFYGAASFNQSLNSWDVSNVTIMLRMFLGASSFNGDISSWQVGNCGNFSFMFAGATSFNQDIGNWDVGQGFSIFGMFSGATSFNQDIGNWDIVSNNLQNMFNGAVSFDQNLGTWDVSNVINMSDMFASVKLSIENYDSLLIGWSQLPSLQPNIILNAGFSKYCEGKSARETILNTYNWTIIDQGELCRTPFITTWKTDNPGTSSSNEITIPTIGSGYNYTVDWGDGNIDDNITGDITHFYTSSGTYTISITGSFPRIYFNNSGDRQKILSVEEWGNQDWTSMESAFYGCSNLVINALDGPDLSQVERADFMFANATNMNQNIDHWDVSNVTSMYGMFTGASSFNQSLNNWNVSNVTNMSNMFQGASSFNSDINNWNVSNVIFMPEMFFFAQSFNQDLQNWNVSQVEDMSTMFAAARDFNGDISSWNTGQVVNMGNMFQAAINFNVNISNWDVSNVNQMAYMFNGSASFDQDLGSWNVSQVTDMSFMFESAGLSTTKYDQLLIGWSMLPALQPNVNFHAGSSFYCFGETARNDIINTYNWTITDNGKQCPNPFLTTWKTDNPGISADNEITIPTLGNGYNYIVDWGDGNFDYAVTGSISHSYTSPGVYQVGIYGDFPRIFFFSSGDKEKILSIDQWGEIAWASMYAAFYQCYNLTSNASDTPDLSNVTNLSFMFSGDTLFNANISSWDVSNVENMEAMFQEAKAFNQDIRNWDVSQVNNMKYMFFSAQTFNQDIGSWDVSQVNDMSYMFTQAINFNGNISQWNVENVTNLSHMFYNAPSFNQDIGNWDVSQVNNMLNMFAFAWNFNWNIGNWNVSNVTDMTGMFWGATAFDRDLGNWNVSNVMAMDNMFLSVGLSSNNYDGTLIGWANLPSLQSNVNFNAGNSQYCQGEMAKNLLINSYGWNINDGGPSLNCCTTSTTFTAGNWDNGVPTSTINAIIDDNYDTATDGGSINACGVTINPGVTLTINDGHYLHLKNELMIKGDLILKPLGTVNAINNN